MGPPARRQAATHGNSERRKGLLYSRTEEVAMALWRWSGVTDVGSGHMDTGRTDKGPRPGNFRHLEAEAAPHRTCM